MNYGLYNYNDLRDTRSMTRMAHTRRQSTRPEAMGTPFWQFEEIKAALFEALTQTDQHGNIKFMDLRGKQISTIMSTDGLHTTINVDRLAHVEGVED